MKRIAIDMDNVIADITSAFINSYHEETGIRVSHEDIKGKVELDAFPNIRKWIYTEGYFRNLPVIADSQRVIKRLMEHYDVFIVSAATEFPRSLYDKIMWMEEYFPFIGWQKICLCGYKTIIKADILIDDHFKNLDHFDGETFLFTASHNALAENGRHRRVDSWLEIEEILLNA